MCKPWIIRSFLSSNVAWRLGTYHRKVLCNAPYNLWFLLKAIGAARLDDSTGEAEFKIGAIQQRPVVSLIFFFLQLHAHVNEM